MLEVSQLASYASPESVDHGLFYIISQNVHGGAGNVTDTIPLFPPSTTLNGPLDTREFDMWLHSAHLISTVLANTAGAAFMMNPSARAPAITGGFTGNPAFPVATWDTFENAGGTVVGVGHKPLGFKVPRLLDAGAEMSFVSTAVTGATNITGFIIAELVPLGLRPSAF